MFNRGASYRSILTHAWSVSWQHKHLWVFGLFAGVVNTGGVIDVVFRTFKRAADDPSALQLLDGSLPGLSTIRQYLEDVVLLPADQAVLTIAILLLILFTLIVLGVGAQTSLLISLGGIKRHKPRHWHGWLRHPELTLWRVFAIDVAARVATSLIMFVVAFLFVVLRSETLFGNTIGNFAVLLLFVPLLLAVNYLSVFGVVEVVLGKKGLVEGIKAAAAVLRKHWLPITEIAIILFLANLLATLVLLASLIIFAIPYLGLLLGALATGLGALWIGVILIGTLGVATIFMAFGGWMTTFTYAAWVEAYQKLGGRSRLRAGIAHMAERLSLVSHS